MSPQSPNRGTDLYTSGLPKHLHIIYTKKTTLGSALFMTLCLEVKGQRDRMDGSCREWKLLGQHQWCDPVRH